MDAERMRIGASGDVHIDMSFDVHIQEHIEMLEFLEKQFRNSKEMQARLLNEKLNHNYL
tara:strand:+ start:33337 stop:33513 length:177 start_codon:yes stop_codon:yes gene_type:complete